MTVLALLAVCLVLLRFGFTGSQGMVAAMSIVTIICIALCLSGDLAQNLKTGYLLGATPRSQQVMKLVALFLPALVMGYALYQLGDAFGFAPSEQHPHPLLAPQANVMAVMIQSVFSHYMPWMPIMVGVMIAAGVELLGANSLPFAVGLYLPLSLSTPIMAGGIIAALVGKSSKDAIRVRKRQEQGLLFGSGLIAADALIGVLSAALIAGIPAYRTFFQSHESRSFLTGGFGPVVSLMTFLLLAVIFLYAALSRE